MRKRQKIAMLVAILLAALMILPLLLSAFASLLAPKAAAITQKEIDDMKKNLGVIVEEKKKLKNDIAALKQDKNAVLELIRAYDDQIALNELAKEETTGLIQHLNESIAAQQIELDEAVRREQEHKERFIRRLQAMDRMEEISYIGVLLEAQSFSDLLTRWDDIREITSYDRKIIDELHAAAEEIDSRRASLDTQKQELFLYRDELAATELEYATLRKEQRILFEEIERDEDLLRIKLLKTEEDELAVDREIAKKTEEKRKQDEEAKRKLEYTGGVMKWPVPGHTRISSYFGARERPTAGASTNHRGIDIPAPSGTPIVAANDGVILIRAKSGSYGNYIVIDHGGNTQTLYGHMSKFGNYQVGQNVKKGDTIGYVGTTGVSTGNHLHFEVIVGGVKKDPLPWVKG